MFYQAQPLYPWQEGPPAELPPPHVPDIARQMTGGVVGIGVAMMALSMVSSIMSGVIHGTGVAAVAKGLKPEV